MSTLRAALAELVACGIEYDGPRYLLVQVPHEVMAAARAALAQPDDLDGAAVMPPCTCDGYVPGSLASGYICPRHGHRW
jgi:hypothetical protein